jgi:hypothetical protein
MQYIIRAFNESNGQITVEYDGKWTYAIDLPIEDGAFPVGEKLEEIIQGMAPTWLVERQQKLATTPLNSDVIRALVQPLPVVTDHPTLPPMAPLNEAAMESDIAFIEEVVNGVLAAKGL